MFCSQCGASATGRFCWKCGAPLHEDESAPAAVEGADPQAAPAAQAAPATPPAPATAPAPATPAAADSAAPADWSDEISYKVLSAVPEVRDRIAHAAAGASRGVSAEDFLEAGDKLFAASDKALHTSFAGPLPLTTVAELVEPVYERLGIRTGKRRSAGVQYPPGRVIVAILCSLASRSLSLDKVDQARDGCVIEAKIPPSPRAMAASLVVTATRQGSGTRVEAAATVRGQMFDWGLSRSVLDHLFADIDKYAPSSVVG